MKIVTDQIFTDRPTYHIYHIDSIMKGPDFFSLLFLMINTEKWKTFWPSYYCKIYRN